MMQYLAASPSRACEGDRPRICANIGLPGVAPFERTCDRLFAGAGHIGPPPGPPIPGSDRLHAWQNRFMVIWFQRSEVIGMLTRLTVGPLLAAFAAAAAMAQSTPARPRIIGISHLAVYASDPAAAEHFYTVSIGAVKMPDPE